MTVMQSTNINKRMIDIQKRFVTSSFGLADAVCDQVERMADIHRPNWISQEVADIFRDLFRQNKEWRMSAKDILLEGYGNWEKSLSNF